MERPATPLRPRFPLLTVGWPLEDVETLIAPEADAIAELRLPRVRIRMEPCLHDVRRLARNAAGPVLEIL